jgi:hypothetical protein
MASEDNNSAVVVDETPISPVRSNERRNSLEKHLQHRPEAQDLKNRHILLDTTTAPYVLTSLLVQILSNASSPHCSPQLILPN